MHFTQEDYRKIEAWLLQRTVKDTELSSADPMDGTERVPILQDNKNKTIGLNDFVKQVADMKLPDFYNVTVNSKRPYLTLREAVSLVPVKQRKLGLTITYHNERGNWLIYQFKGDSLNQWDSLNYWNNIIQEAIEDLVLYPDEEDVTGVRDGNRTFIKFKDREYNPEEFSGMGMIILRKNLVGTAACSIDDEDHLNNVLTQDMINQENTVYIVQYDFDLDGKVISIPRGCTLWFQGGSINNGTIYLQETAILGAFEFADMGTAKLFGKFNPGQVMTFSNDSYRAKEGGYFVPTTKPSSATEKEDAKNENETFYDTSSDAYTTKTRQELRWWNGEEWLLILDITDYKELKTIISDLIDKHNAEMSACYKYFKARCYALEVRMDDAERRLDEHDKTLENHETGILTIKTAGGTTLASYDGSSDKTVTLPEGSGGGGDTFITAKETLTIKQGDETLGQYDGTEPKTIEIPEVASVAEKVNHKLKFTGAVNTTYDGSKEITVNIPTGSGTTVVPADNQPLTFKGAVDAVYDGKEAKEVTIPAPTTLDDLDTESLIIKNASGDEVASYNAKGAKEVQLKKLHVKTNLNDTKDALPVGVVDTKYSGSLIPYDIDLLKGDGVIDMTKVNFGTSEHPIVLYAARIKRTSNNSVWHASAAYKHPFLSATVSLEGNAAVKIGLSSAHNNDYMSIHSAVASFSTSTAKQEENNTNWDRYRSNVVGLRCGVDGRNVYVQGVRTADKNNDSLDFDPAAKGGTLLGFNIIIVGHINR